MSDPAGGPNLKDLMKRLRQIVPNDLSGSQDTPRDSAAAGPREANSEDAALPPCQAPCDKSALDVCAEPKGTAGGETLEGDTRELSPPSANTKESGPDDPLERGEEDLITEFRCEIENKHNTLLGKMQLLREALAKQLQKTDEREDVQKKTFAKWINSQLAKGQHPPVTDLFYDLRDGTRLLALLEVLTNKTYKREKGRMRVHHLNNVSRALSILEEHNVKLINISNEHIVDGSAKLTLGLVWAIILHWQVQGVLKDVMSDLQQTNLEKTLLAWCRQTTKGYHGVDVRNFTTSWTDGLAFNALIHSHRPQLFDWTVMARKHPYARLENAFRLANEHFNIERLLDPEDVNSQVPDKKSIMMYVMCLFQALPHGSFTMESLDVSIQSDSSFSLDTSSENVAQATSKGRPLSNVSIGLGEYQRTLEEVLTWLLGAEDRLAVMPPIANSTEEVKDQFHDLEELMLELTSKQGGIGDVLGEGSRLLKEGVMEEEEEEEVRVQMKLLNTRWEDLRVKAMDRQSRLHEKLMTLQQTQLESLKKWLTETEDRIANMSQVGPTTDLLREQIAAHQSLQEDLESEQANINSLSNMVVVVDESSSDSAYSSLEDELNALGERWAHICRWAESRWKTLQTLSVHWTHYEQEMNKMGEWMNEKESLLREVESNPSSDQEHILRQASMLQILQAEMEVQHRRFEHLQEESAKVLSHLPQDSPGQEKIPSELEMVQDRLDCLVSIIEAQTQRMAANGIDIKKVVIPADNTSDIVSSSTTTISHEDATVVTKIITTKIVTTETVEGSVIKRQKLEGGSQEDFSVALHQLGGWMDSLEAEVRPKVAGELTVEQLMQLAQQLENEIESQKEEYYKVVSLGQSAISETSTIGESAKESEQQVAGITSRWEALNAMLIEIRTRITFLTQKKKVTTQLSDLEVQYEGFLRWCDDVRTVSENEPNAVSLQIEQCQSKIAAMESHESEISALKVACEALDSNFAQETQPVMEQVQIFITKWEALKIRLVEWNVTLKERLGQVSPSPMVVETVQTAPPESLVKAMEASRKWLESLETALATEHVVSSLPQMQDMLLKFQDLSQKVEMEQGNMKHINDACSALIKEGQIGISEDFTKLNKQWETTTEALQSRIKAIEKVIEKQKQYNDEVSGLCSWMSEVDVFLQAEEPALGDIETLEAQLEQSNALQDDIVTLENNVANITTSGKQLMDEAEPELKGAISVQLDELTKRWALVTELAKAQNKSLKDALAKSQKVHEDIQALNTWLDEMDQKVPSFGPVETSSELSAAIDLFSKLREEISEHSEEFRGVNNTGNEMLQHDAAATHEELARQFTQLNGRWTDVVTQVDSRHRVLSTASEQYDDFKKLCGEETEWLNQLQEKLEKSSKSAADAEEISEALDDLEIFLHSHNESRLEQIRNLAEALVQENCMSVAVQNATHTLTSRFDTLNAQASEHQSGLEGRVQEAQAWEREYVSVLDYLVQSDMVLTQAITDSQLRIDPVQVQAELVKQQEVLKKMQTQVDVYRTQGKTEAALRLEDQVTHLLKKYEEVEMKLRLCQKPSDFDDRLQQMNQELKDISQRVHLVTVTSGDPEGIQEQLNQCMALYQRLSEVKAEVESVIATGRKIVKEGQALDPETLTLQLDQLKGLYNQLGGTVTEHRGVLERALRHSRKIHKDSSHLEEWLSTTECELDQREATIPTRNVEGEVHFAQHAIDDLGRKRPLLTGLHESYAALASMCDDDALLQPIKEQVDDIALTWERVNTRLANRLKNMQSEQVNKEAEMEKFIVGLGEIKGWLQSTEYQLTNLSAMDADEQARIIKSISTEVQNYKGHIENIRDTAVDLINHGALFQARVQPELIEINQRWENIFKNVQVKYEDIEDTVSIHSQNEEDEISSVEAEHQLMETDTSNSEKIEACRADVEPVISVRETGDRSEFEKDIVIKKRKRFGKLYEEVDNDIKEMTSEAKLTKSTGSASSTSYVPYKEEKVTPEELEKVMRKRGLLTKKALYENWESISSCSSGNESKRGSSTEGSIDFGSETRGAVSGDWDDAPILTDLNLQNPSAESKSVPVESIPEEAATDPRKEELRFSFVSSSSIEIDRDEVFTSEVEMDFQDVDALAEVAEIDSPSSDESDDLEEPSKVRISAATIYEDAVIQALEGGNERGTKKRKKINVNPQIDKVEAVKNEPQTSCDNRASVCSFSEQLSEEIIEPKSDVTESTARFEEKEKESTEKAHQPEESSKSLLTMHESPKIRDGEALLASEGKHEGEESVHKKQPNEGEVLEIIYEVVTVTRTKEPKAQTVIERVIIEPEETVSETESDTEETLKTRTEPKGYLPADEKHSKSGNEYLRSNIDALSLSANTTSKDSDAETDRDVIDADVKAKIDLSPSSSQALRGEPKCRDSQDGEKQMVCVVQTTTNITHTLPSINEDVPNNSKPACEVSHEILQGEGDKIDVDVTISELASENSLNKVIPQYTSSVRDEKETYEIAIESQMNSSIAVSLVSVEVEEVFNKADVSETSTDESKQYRIKEDHEGSPECSMKSGTVMDEASKVLLVVSKHEQYVQKDPETMEDFPGIEETVDKAVSHSFMDTHKTENIPEGVHAHYKQGTDDKSLASVITGRNEEVFVNPVVDDISDNLTTETFEDEVKNSSHRPSGSDSEDSLKEFGKEDDIQTGQLTRRLSTSSSSSSNSSFEMVECEPEVDLEEQLSSHESYEEAEIEDKEELVESDESLDKMTECTTIGEAVHPEIASISLEIKLERHVSIDSSVSTLSEAETVIHVPIGSLPKKISETASVKDDSQIGVKSGEAKDPLVRSVSEELITKTGNQGGIKQIGKSPTVPEAVESGKEDVKKDEEKEEVAASYVEVKPIQQKEFRDDTGYQKAEVVTTGIKVDDDMKGCPVEIISSVPIRHEYYPVESCTISTLPVNVSKHNKEEKKYSDSVVLMNPGFLMVEPSCIVEEENTENADMDKSAYVNIIKDKKKEDPGYTFLSKAEEKSPLNVSRTDDSVKEVPLVHEEGWTEIKILNVEEKDQVNLERRVSVDVAQVVQTTEVSEEQEVTISIPDIHSEDLRDDSSVQSDEEQASKVCKLKEENPVDYIPKQISEGEHFIVLQHHVESRKLPADSPAKTEVPLDVSNYHGVEAKADDNIVDIIGEEETSISLGHGRITSSISDDAEKVGLGITHKNDGKEVHSYSHYELKDIGFVVIEEHSDPKYANLENKEHKDLKEKESSSSCNTSNSNSSSPYYDASGEMVESLGSDEVSSSMEVLHSSAEILDSSQANWSSMTDQSMPSLDGQSHDEGSDKSVPLREIRKGPLTWSGQRDSRFSTISCCTDASEGELIFSETEGEELPYEDTTDDDLTLEEEAIKVLAEKHEAGGTPKPAAVSFTKDTSRQQTQTSSSTVTSVSKISHVYTTQSAVKGGKETHKAGDDEVDAYLREVTLLADKITELKKKAGTVPSYQEAKDKSEALEQEVALLEPDVATVISRGDTLTLTTHMVDVPRANTIRTAVHDLRTHWSSLKGETETVKLETGEVITKINNIQSKSDDIVGWMNDVSKRLHLVNNDESQLEALEKEMADKKSELDNLNESGKLLKKYGYEQIQPLLAIINTRWIELTTQFSQYRKVSLEKKTIVSSNAQQEVEPVVVPDFIASVNRLREAISAISRQLNANKLAGRRYDNLKLQEEELKTIKQGLETLKPRVDNLETERNNTIKNVTQTQSEQIRRVMDKLREEWAQVNRGYTERHALWLQCSETWRTLQKTIDDFSVWLSTIEERVQITANQPLPEAKITQKELEKQVTLKHRPSQTLQSTCKEVTEDMSLDDAKRLQERVDTLMKRWRALLLDLAARRERIAGEEGGKDSTSSEYEALLVWVDQAQALMDAPVNVTDEATLSAHSTMIQNHLVEMTTKQNLLKKLKDSKPKAVTPAQLSTLETNLNKVAKTLPEYKNLIETKLGVTKTLVTDVEDLYKWTEEMRVKVALRNMTDEEIKLSKITLREKETLYENLDSTYWVLAQDTESKGLTVSVALKNRMNTIESRLKALQGQLYESSASATPPSPTSPTFSRITPEKADQEKVVGEKDAKAASKEGEVLKKAAAVAVAASKTTPEVVTTTSTKTTTTKGKVEKTEALSVTSGTTVTSSVTSVIQNVIKFEESVFGAEGALRPPSPLVCPPKHAPDSSPVLILASLDKSILQIRDWLTLMEQMTRQQTVVVGDADDIRQLTEKQKNVLRELEGKKPQLDELVASADSLKDDASRTQLHQKVSKLREHWDETNSVVLARKTQLDAMYADTHKFDAKRAELETWLARMEARLERMAPVAHTADVLDQQIREQKGFHAEIHQYKHQVELFNQMTQRLIAIYQHDDTRRLKKITETINLRYSSLNSSIIARGKALHSAMNSLHNFDKALDKFASWMSEAESSTDILELEVDKLGPGRRDLQARAPIAHLKDLQSEIESHKDVLASLNATGQKLLGTLENQDEAVMLQRRLEEMNQRWNTLKHKSIAIRNRLEGNAENWNSLLLSLRELIEWVIRKDTELTALGPLVGDLNALAKFSDDLAAFRRVIDEKQPVIESNLKSGRQLIASEPPLSDTSDSEAGRELDGDARYRGDDNARDLTRAVRREVAKLSEKWAALRERAAAANAQADLACKKLGVLQKTVEEVSGRLEEAQKTVDTWGAVPQDPNLADQHVHNVRKFREGLAELQRGVDDVNDQAARFSAHNVPLTPANSAKLHDLNNRWKTLETTVNDRWRQVAGRSREVTPLTPAQLASSVSPPWERATTSNKVPYYINHDQESTHWDHPTMMDLLDSLTEFNHIKFSAYRTATKLRMLQKTLALDRAKMQMATDVFDEHGLRGQNDRLIDVGDMVVVLSALYANISADHPEVNTTLAMDLCLNWLLNVYDSQRTGQMRVLSFKIGIVCLCRGHLEEKYRYMFRLIADPNRLVDQRKLGLLLHDCVQVPRQLGEVAAFGGSNIEPSVRSCFTKAGKDRETIEAVHFLTWVQQEPQSLVWLAVLHRVAASENIQHQVKCNICKAYPIVGLRYRCLKCLSFDMCQRCFFDGRSGKSHKITHPMHEYCTATTAGEDVKDFTKALKNKFKSKRALQKHTKKGYLPVQTVLEGDPLESPSPSPQHNVTSQDMHSRLELYASRLAEVELRTNSNSTPDRSLVSSLSEDEHGLIAQYCQSLSSSDAPLPVPRSPLQIMAAVDAEQKDELEQMIRALEEENSQLQAEYDRLKSQQPVGSPPDDGLSGQRSEADMLAEAKLLRQHKGRLEARMGILEEHNRQLEAQLHRLRQLLGEPGGMSSPNKSGTLQTKSVTASQLAMDSPAKVNGHSNQGGASSAYEGLDQMSEYVRPPPPPMGSVAHVGNLFSRAGDLGKAVGTLVATMTHEGASDLPSDEEERSEASDTEEEKAV